MQKVDNFLLNELKKTFKHTQIGFMIDEIKPYKKAWASIRIKCYDVIKYFDSIKVASELYKPFKKYRTVVFVKTSSSKAAKRAQQLHRKGVRIIYNAYCDHLTDETRDDEERRNTIKILECSDEVIVCTQEQKQQFDQFHEKVRIVYESVPEEYFCAKKIHEEKNPVTLVYCGYSHKAKDTLVIKHVLEEFIKNGSCELLYLCEKDPQIDGLPYRFVQYDQSRIQEQLLMGDIAIAPRKMEGIDKLSHSFTKVALTGAVGLPTVASPIPSYINTPVALCYNEQEWRETLSFLVQSPQLRQLEGGKLRDYIRENYSINVIGEQYKEIFL